MIITSSAFDDGGMIPKKFTCDGGDINPELLIQNVPAEAQSLALILHDPDAPSPGGFTHWTVWNIDPGTTLIKDESIPPSSVEGSNDAKKVGYFGPCPPSGAPHHYRFQLYALDAILDLPEGAPVAVLRAEIDKHIITMAELVGLYARA
ncbi:MAG TPA: YbhB/YbcL family Raf kinase inhibitor-like protein [Candidatus Paceibacterota bacterium]|nr:YbhB/YbcL family Raf kinase inhibitor-like protein [Candidatus Paceibacterota bacterium]